VTVRSWSSRSEADTEDLGAALGRELRDGGVVLIEGPLGAGKTAFVRGLARGLGAEADSVSSPTFTLVQEYGGRLRLQHADLYRLTPAEAADLALDEMVDQGVLAVEWPDRWHGAPADAWRVRIEPGAADDRTVTVSSPPSPTPPSAHSTR
jgi:tRNA threonylcarbamoyladenosine biosynthesis protein TsaE